MRPMPPTQPNLFKIQSWSALSGSQRARALELLQVLLKEAMSATEAGAKRRDREVDDDQ
jgi:hypothetical protein